MEVISARQQTSDVKTVSVRFVDPERGIGFCFQIMIKNTLPILEQMGVAPASVYTSIETRLKCGIGKCGRYRVSPIYVCKEGPMLTMQQLQRLPADY